MKVLSINKSTRGFSTLELLIALSLIVIVMTGAVAAISSAQYWLLTSKVSLEALYKNKAMAERVQSDSLLNFQNVSSTVASVSLEAAAPSDQSCLTGGLCYFTQTTVADISSCAKAVRVDVSWKLGLRYATSTLPTTMFINHPKEITALGGDCLVREPEGNWGLDNPLVGSSASLSAQGISGMDVLGEYAYVTSNLSPYFRVYRMYQDPLSAPVFISSSSESGVRLNDIDVIRDYKTGRSYAYVTKHSSTSQLAVYDVTEPASPTLLIDVSLFGVSSTGSFPQGWRVMAYGNQLFVVSRETTGPELHIFSIINPRLPVELTSAVINLNRTVNDLVVRDATVAGVIKRFLYLAASSDLKEVGVYDVTGSVPIEVAAINLSGAADASSLHLNGNRLYVGRKSSPAPELYVFDAEKLTKGVLDLKGSSEVGADVLSLAGSAQVLYVGTGKSGAELQIWSNDITSWSTTVVNSGRLSFMSFPRLASLGIDSAGNNIYLVSTSLTLPETMAVIYTP